MGGKLNLKFKVGVRSVFADSDFELLVAFIGKREKWMRKWRRENLSLQSMVYAVSNTPNLPAS